MEFNSPIDHNRPLVWPFSPLKDYVSIFLGVTLPSLLMIPLFWNEIKSAGEDATEYWDYYDYYYPIEEESGSIMTILFIALCVLCAASLLYGLWAALKRKTVKGPVWVAVSAFFSAWLTIGIYSLPSFSRATATSWLFICTLAMLPLLCSLAHIVIWLTPKEKEHSIKKTLLPLIAVPMLWYLMFNTFRYAYYLQYDERKSAVTVVIMLAVVATYCLLFILFRVLYLLAAKKESFWKVTRIVILFFLPLMGLLVTQIAPDFSFFWDFSSPLYYLLTILNGILLMLREPRRRWLRLLLFLARCCTYIFVTYFFICLSPFYTLSLLGLLVFGLGILVLAPVFLWIYQTKVLLETGKELFRLVGGVRTILAGLVGAAILPALVILSFHSDKANFEKAISYLDGAAAVVGEDNGAVDIEALRHSEQYIQYNAQTLHFDYMNRYQTRKPPPLLRQVYTKVINDGEPLDYSTTSKFQALYHHEWSQYSGLNYYEYYNYYDVAITDIQVETLWDGRDYRSTVHFVMQNMSEWEDLAEFRTSFRMPDGVFISGYYLDVDGVRKDGLLSERSAAVSLYEDIVYMARDPGILYYDGEYITFRVFPFAEQEVRYTGIEFLHREPVTLEIDGWRLELRNEEGWTGDLSQPLDGGNGILYFSAEAKEQLPVVKREPLYQFVVDCSKDSDIDMLVSRIQAFCEQHSIRADQATVTALNYRRAVWEMSDPAWVKGVKSFASEGGFGLGFVSDTIARECEDANRYPVLIAVTDHPNYAVFPSDTAYIKERSPETDGYFILMEDDEIPRLFLVPYDNRQSDYLVYGIPQPQMRLAQVAGRSVYLRDNSAPEVVVTNIGYDSYTGAATGNGWTEAMQLYGQYINSLETEDETEKTLRQLQLIKNSFRTGIMTPYTSYIVLETPEQEQELLERQARILEEMELQGILNAMGGSEVPWDDGNPMGSEPSILLFAVVLVPFVLMKRRKERA